MGTINDNRLDFIRFDFNAANISHDLNVNDFQTRALNLSRKHTPDNIEKVKVKSVM